jgi:hypothetical protein
LTRIEEDKSMEIVDEPKVFKNKREFKEYIVECREFDALYMKPSSTIESLKKASQEKFERDRIAEELQKNPVDKKVSKEKSLNKLMLDFFLSQMSVNYVKGILLHMCLLKKRSGFTSWLIEERNLIPFLSTFLIRIMIS